MADFETLFKKINAKASRQDKGPVEVEPMAYDSLFSWEGVGIIEDASAPQDKNRASNGPALLLKEMSRRRNMRKLAGIFAFTFLTGYYFTLKINPTYSSVRQYYVPNQNEDFSARLTHLASRLNFVSMPSRWQMPMRLLSRQISDQDSRKKVIQKLRGNQELAHQELSKERLQSVSVTPFYNVNEQLLVIQGSADNPEVAAEVTDLYGAIIEEKLAERWKLYQSELLVWIRNSKEVLSENILELNGRLRSVKASSRFGSASIDGPSEAGKNKRELERALIRKRQTLAHLRRLQRNPSMEALSSSFVPDIKSYVAMYIQLKSHLDNLAVTNADADTSEIYQNKIDELKNGAIAFIQNLYSETKNSLIADRIKIANINSRIRTQYSASSAISVDGEDETLLKSRLRQDQETLSEIESLGNQILVNNLMSKKSLVLLQAATSNPGSRVPNNFVVLFLLILGSVSVAFLGVYFHLFVKRNSQPSAQQSYRANSVKKNDVDADTSGEKNIPEQLQDLKKDLDNQMPGV